MAKEKQPTQEALQQKIFELEAEISELKVRNIQKTDELKQEILNLKTRNTQKVASDRITLLGLDDKLKSFSVDCKIVDVNSTDKSKCIVFGRPPIAESSTKQQRHITPYSFLELIVDKYTTDLFYSTIEESRAQLLQLIPPLKTLVSFTSSGLGFTKQNFEQLQQLITSYPKFQNLDDVRTWLQITTTLDLDHRDYYLVHDSIVEFLPPNSLKDKQKQDAQNLYQAKMKKLLQYTIEELSNDIIHCDSVGIINESLVKLVLTLFNNRPNISLPNNKEHTLNYSIRLYDKASDARQDKDTGFETVTSDELYKLYTEKYQTNPLLLNNRIRIVKDEGAVVKATIACLKKISQIVQLLDSNFYDTAQESINYYNNTLVKERKVLKEYTEQLILPNLSNTLKEQKTVVIDKLYTQNIPFHLYHVFDFKPLEAKVFVPIPKTKEYIPSSLVYVKGEETQKYYFQDGKDYRCKPCKEVQLLRNDIKFLAHKVVDHVITSILAFFDFQKGHSDNLRLLEAFSQKVTDSSSQYKSKSSQAYKKYETEFTTYYKEYDIFNTDLLSDDDIGSTILGATNII